MTFHLKLCFFSFRAREPSSGRRSSPYGKLASLAEKDCEEGAGALPMFSSGFGVLNGGGGGAGGAGDEGYGGDPGSASLERAARIHRHGTGTAKR